jgi:ABC-type cobalamin/Fe3+-siderophores transport system ATPase subunit
MKFKNIEFIDHPILGHCSFDFTNKDENIVDTIIIAGENGCGKSVFLNELYNFNPSSLLSVNQGELKSTLILTENEFSSLTNYENFRSYVPIINNDYTINKEIVTHRDLNIKDNWQQSTFSLKNTEMLQISIMGNYWDPMICRSIFSDVEINFSPNNISYITSENIDKPNLTKIKSESNLATSITQLLIDIKSLDDSDLSDWVAAHPGIAPPDEVKEIRMKRFTKAFDSIFPHKRFKGIRNINGQKKVLFEEFGKEMPIEKLSSGEKQIVFRGGFLLKDKMSTEGAFVLVDEPELSLHPRWQMKILSFLKSLFTNEEGIQTSQIIITTHSPFIIHNCDRSNDKVIILEKSEEGVISVSDTPSYYSWTNEELVKEAFNITYALPNDKITVFLEGETDERYYKRALEVYDLVDSILNFKWIGNYNEQGNVENSGDTGLNHAFNFYKANPRMINNKVVLLYDSDTKKQESQLDNNLYIKMMAVNNGNGLYKIGIENLLMLHNGFDKDRYYKTEVKPNKYGGETTTRNLDKTKLCNEICQLDNETLKEVFTNIKLEIDKLLVL